ncbi:MAG: asparagine synthase C-terminal domain-containing protein [Microgenomates group bacterium]
MNKKILEKIDFILKESFEKYKKKYHKKVVGVLVSGGIDSSIIAWWVRKTFPNCVFLSVACKTSKDWIFLDILEKFLKKKIIRVNYDSKKIKKAIFKVIKIYKKRNFSIDLTHLSLGVCFLLCLEETKKRRVEILFSGQGPDILLGGYHRYKKIKLGELNQTIKNELTLLKKDVKREKILSEKEGIKIIYPFIEKNFIDFCLKIPANLKIKNGKEKYILRKYGEFLGLPEEITFRPKKAFQYSTGIFKAVKKLIE